MVNYNQVLGSFLIAAPDPGNIMLRLVLKLLLIDYIEHRYNKSLPINTPDDIIDEYIRNEQPGAAGWSCQYTVLTDLVGRNV